MKKFLALLLSIMMVMSCFASLSFVATAEENTETETTETIGQNLIVPQDQWTVSGHCPQIVGAEEGHANSPMVAAGGVASGALLHQGAIGLGEIDLSQYSKVIVHYGVDNSDVTWNHYNASANNRIMLVTADTHLTNSPAEETILAGATYEPCGWSVVAFEIDLTGVDYNGPVFLTYDTLPGTFMLFSSVEFVFDENILRETSTECTFAYDFTKYSENVTADVGITNVSGVTVNEVCKNGYVTLESTGGDPFFSFTNAPTVPASQTDYVVIKYRTSVAGATGELFTGRSDGLGWAAPMEKTHVDITYVADGQWHTMIVDASGIWGDSKTANLKDFRFDCLKSAGIFDLAYIKFFATLEGAEACVAAETKEVKVSGEYLEGADGVIIVGGQAYSADQWVKLREGSAEGATQTFEGNPDHLSICADNARYCVGGEQKDWCTQEGHVYMASIESKIQDPEGAYEYISFRGWANPTIGDVVISEFGYAINDQAPVFNASFAISEPSLKEAVGAGAERYENIIIPTAGLADGIYNIYLLAKDTNGIIYNMNGSWGGDFQYIKGNVTAGSADCAYSDAQGNGYNVRADGILFDTNGYDTGLTLFTDDFGTPYGVAHYFALEYQDPAAGAVEIDGTKYTYTTQVTLSPKMEAVLPEDNSVVPESLPAAIGGMSPDTYFVKYQGENEVQVNDGGSHEYIANTLGGKILDIDKNMEHFALRGWSKDDAGQQTVAEYGYQLNDMEPVFSSDWIQDGSDINAVFQISYGSRYKIVINVADLPDGIYNVYPLVKHADGSVAYLNVWGNIQFVKGGSWKQVGYTDGTNTYVKAEDGSVTVNGEANDGKMLVSESGVIYYGGVTELGEGAKGKYLYDVTLTYTETPEIPVNPAELKPVYLIDGENLNPNGGTACESDGYSYDNGYITFKALNADPNSSNNLVPAGTKIGRYMVVKYRTTTEGANGEVFVGASTGALGAKDNTKLPAYVADGEWHTLVADIGNVVDWPADGVVNHFRNDFLMSEGSVDIEYYAFFDTMKEAVYYAEHDMHVLPKAPVYYTITFKAEGEIVKEYTILEGTTSVKEPAVPEKEGFTGVWEDYTITGDADQVINAVYTEIVEESGSETEPGEESGNETEPGEESGSETEPGEESGSETEPGEESGSTTEPGEESGSTTEPGSENESESKSEPVDTDPVDTAPQDTANAETATQAAGTDPADEDSGCASAVASISLVTLLAAACAVVALKKKED